MLQRVTCWCQRSVAAPSPEAYPKRRSPIRVTPTPHFVVNAYLLAFAPGRPWGLSSRVRAVSTSQLPPRSGIADVPYQPCLASCDIMS